MRLGVQVHAPPTLRGISRSAQKPSIHVSFGNSRWGQQPLAEANQWSRERRSKKGLSARTAAPEKSLDGSSCPPLIDRHGSGAGPSMVKVRPTCSEADILVGCVRSHRGRGVETPVRRTTKKVQGSQDLKSKHEQSRILRRSLRESLDSSRPPFLRPAADY